MIATMFVNYRLFSLAAIAGALFVLNAPIFAANEVKEATHDGKLIGFSGDQLLMTNNDGREYSYTLTADARLTLDGKVCKAADLKRGTRLRVTTQGEDERMANHVEAVDKNPEFEIIRQDGIFVSITDNRLVMTDTQSEVEHSRKLTVDVKVTCDGKDCELRDLKPGMRVRVSSQSEKPDTISRIEALDTSPQFASI